MTTHAISPLLHRVVEILKVFEYGAPPLTASDLSRRTELPMSTTHRLVGELVAAGFLDQDEQRRLRIGVMLWELGTRSSHPQTLRAIAQPYLEDIHSVVRHHTKLAVLDVDEVLYVDILSHRNAVIDVTRIATRQPALTCSSGMVLAAYGDTDLQERLLSKPPQRFSSRTITDPSALRQELSATRQNGYSLACGWIHETASGVAVPVFDPDGAAIAAISVNIPTSEPNPLMILPALLTASRGITRRLTDPLAREALSDQIEQQRFQRRSRYTVPVPTAGFSVENGDGEPS